MIPERMRAVVDEYYSFTNDYPESKYAKEAKAMLDQARSYLGENN